MRLARGGLAQQYVVYERQGTWYFAAGAAAELTVDATWVRARADGVTQTVPTGEHPLEQLAEVLHGVPGTDWRAFGWTSFELAHLIHGNPEDAGADTLLHLIVPLVEVEMAPDRARIRASTAQRLERTTRVLARPDPPEREPTGLTPPNGDSAPYRRAVARTIDDIRARRLDKAVLSRVVPLPDTAELSLCASYLTGREANTPARSFLLDLGGWRATGFSPETVIEVDAAGTVSTQPLAGTRARGANPTENDRLREELLADPREVLEHAISVRLAIEELNRACHPDSVSVSEFMAVRDRGSVQHLASRVTGTLRDGLGPWSAFAAVFPAVTATGVPKPAAMGVIRSRESEPRGMYAGSVFMAGADGSLDAALTLRTVFQRGGRSWLRVGAGVMGQSTPEREWEETCEKLRSVAPHLRARTEGHPVGGDPGTALARPGNPRPGPLVDPPTARQADPPKEL